MGEVILEGRNIDKFYKKSLSSVFSKKEYKKVLKCVDIKLYKGEIHGVVGESGSGKSTLCHILARLLKEDGGSIFFENKDITNLGTKDFKIVRKDIQLIFQNSYTSLNPSKKINWLLKESLDINTKLSESEKNNKVAEMLNMVGLQKKHLNRYPKELSGGERQRVSIALSLMLSPKVLIADEAVSALDVLVQGQILNLLMDLKEKLSLSILFITHDLNAVNYLSDRISVINTGEIVETGNTFEIFEKQENEYTKELFSSVRKIKYL